MVDTIREGNSNKLFDIKNEFFKHKIMDQVKFKYKCYQVESLPDGFYELSADKDGDVNCNSCPSYCREAYSLYNIDITQSESNYCEIDSTGGKYNLASRQKLICHCLMFTKFRFLCCYFSEKWIILFLLWLQLSVYSNRSLLILIGSIKDDEGKLKYKVLSPLMLPVYTLSYGNADPETGFSTDKHMLSVHGTY